MADSKRPSKKRQVHPLEAKLGRLYGEAEALTSAHATPVELPQAIPPQLSELSVEVPAPPPVTAEELISALHQRLRALAPRRDRQPGEEVALGDEVNLDVLGYVNDALIPGSVRVATWIDLYPMPHLPGFAQTVAGTKVGDGCALELELPADYPVPTLAGEHARFLVEVRAAREVKELDPDDPAALLTLGMGATLDAVMDTLRSELSSEREALHALEVQDAVLGRLAELTQVDVPASLIDEELRRGWAAHEAPLLKQKGLHPDELAEAQKAWLQSEHLRDEAERSLRVSLALEAIGARDHLELTDAALKDSLDAVAAQVGVDLKTAAHTVAQDAALTERVTRTARHLMLVSHVVQAARVETAEPR